MLDAARSSAPSSSTPSARMRNGSVRPWTTRVKTITAKVRKMSRSRSGNGVPASVLKGRASAAASETEPRMPAHPFTVRTRQLARRSRWLTRRSRLRMIEVATCSHTSRVRTTAAHTAAP